MSFALNDVVGWHSGVMCVPTALAAISGKTPDEIAVVLKQAAGINKREIESQLRMDYNVNDWLTAIGLLGGDWVEAENYSTKDFADRPTIAEWTAVSLVPDIELVFCDDGDSMGHVFAAHDGYLVDTFTDGKRAKFGVVPQDFQRFRIKYTFLV